MPPQASCSVMLNKWVSNDELSSPSLKFSKEVRRKVAMCWVIWPIEVANIWKKELLWPLSCQSSKKEGRSVISIKKLSAIRYGKASGELGFFWSVVSLVLMCLLETCFDRADVNFISRWFFKLTFSPIKSANLEVSFNMEFQWTRVWGDSLGVLWTRAVSGPRE